jgi:hypothetical protein
LPAAFFFLLFALPLFLAVGAVSSGWEGSFSSFSSYSLEEASDSLSGPVGALSDERGAWR